MISNMLIGKRSHEIIAVIVVWLQTKVDSTVIAGLLSGGEEILGKQLSLLVKVVASTLI
jgi:hypothetical protein